MPKIFQQFDLNLEAMTEEFDKLSPEEKAKINLPEAAKTLRKEMLRKGYSVLESQTMYGGIPQTIIVGGEHGMGHKEDFYNLTERLGLKFKSGDYYIETENGRAKQRKPVLTKTEVEGIIQGRIDKIEKIFGFYNDPTKRTSDYEYGRKMLRDEFYSEMEKEFKIIDDSKKV